jgi:DNA-binding NarL/FixJ family response regulator
MPRRTRSDGDDPTTTVLVADGQVLFARRLVAALRAEGGIEVVGQTEDGDGAVRRATVLQPDVAVVGSDLTTDGGQTARSEIELASPATKVLSLVDHAPSTNEVERTDLDDVVAAVRALGEGQ